MVRNNENKGAEELTDNITEKNKVLTCLRLLREWKKVNNQPECSRKLNTIFIKAIKADFCLLVKHLLNDTRTFADLNVSTAFPFSILNRTALHFAVKNSQQEMIAVLLNSPKTDASTVCAGLTAAELAYAMHVADPEHKDKLLIWNGFLRRAKRASLRYSLKKINTIHQLPNDIPEEIIRLITQYANFVLECEQQIEE